MRYMIIVKANRDSEAGVMPDSKVIDGMGRFNEKLIENGMLVAAEGLQASSKGARIRYEQGNVTVLDGPFAEAKELIAGFWIVDVKSKDEVVRLASELMQSVPFEDGEELEIRKVFEAADWTEGGVDPALVAEEQQLRAAAGK